jgi:hypothetical protein
MPTAHQTRKARLSAETEFKRTEAATVEQHPARAYAQPSYVTGRTLSDGVTRFGKPGQCQACGAFRLDGNPPTVHRTDCVAGPDGSQLHALNAAKVPDRIPTKIPRGQRPVHLRR